MLHRFAGDVADIERPALFTYPFCYTPHPLCRLAAAEVQAYLNEHDFGLDEESGGKMFGVLVVQLPDGSIGYLAAYSGILAGSNRHEYFVPPVYDLLRPDGFFKQEEAAISQINRHIEELLNDAGLRARQEQLMSLQQQREEELTRSKKQMQDSKCRREQRRMSTPPPSPDEEASMIRESQYQKAEHRRLKHEWDIRIAQVLSETEAWQHRISDLRNERKERSALLQQQLFQAFKLLNYQGEEKSLYDIFTAEGCIPPAGAGECAAPKLLQYAYLNGWKPLAMAEFWWGASPQTEVRKQGNYYPACTGKCGPILRYMLQGLNVEPNPLAKNNGLTQLQIIYEDEYLAVISKPEGMLAVPGKRDVPSVYDILRERFPNAEGPIIIHRLDMDTSGLMIAAKTKEAHRLLQDLFAHQRVEKRYVALLEGHVPNMEGRITLPICPDPLDRPRQMSRPLHGKPAVTDYHELGYEGERTRILFLPRTGRTHQLRVHAAHSLGLHCPIVGDRLYGHAADRLYLHAEYLAFPHPMTGQTVSVRQPAPF